MRAWPIISARTRKLPEDPGNLRGASSKPLLVTTFCTTYSGIESVGLVTMHSRADQNKGQTTVKLRIDHLRQFRHSDERAAGVRWYHLEQKLDVLACFP